MKWEYKLTNVAQGNSITKFLNELGNDRWELVYCNMVNNSYVFKRPKNLSGDSSRQDCVDLVRKMLLS